MLKTLTDKTHILFLFNNERVHLTKNQAKQCQEAVVANKEFIALDDKLFRSRSIQYIMPAADVEKAQRIKRGEWICRYGKWHQRGEECGHSLLKC